jgi:hypothetical protein
MNARDLDGLRAALRLRCAEVAEALLGTPTFRSRSELRWGRHGSLALAIAGPRAGVWCDHERGEGGDLLDLIMRERRCGFAKAVEWARYWTDTPPLPPPAQPKGKPPP